MLKREIHSICTFYAISPIHAGSGSSLAAVDLPIQRERHTNWPHIQASAIKGAMRAHYRDFAEKKSLINFLFGFDKDDKPFHEEYYEDDKEKQKVDENFPGAISFSDAKLLAFPIRSNIAPFVWVTCPAVLKRLSTDLSYVKLKTIVNIPDIRGENAICLAGGIPGNVILEDMVVNCVDTPMPGLLPEGFPPMEKLVLISDDVFKYAVETCTEIQTQIKIDSKTGTATIGALRYQELLPADSVLYSVVYFSRAVFDNALQADAIRSHLEEVVKDFIQIGGDETLGRGICKIKWISGGAQ
jgi:CRISPR-associated protein Cmr4